MESTSHEALIRLSAFIVCFTLLAFAERLAPRRRRSLALRKRWSGNLGLVAVDTILLRAVPPITAVGVAALVHARGWGVLGDRWVSADLVECRRLGGCARSRDLLPAPAVSRGAGALATAPGASHGPGARCDHRRALPPGRDAALRGVQGGSDRGTRTTGRGGRPVRGRAECRIALQPRQPAAARHVVDRSLRAVLVTPDMHRVHHSADPTETNTNFGFTLSWWDRLFGTYRRQPKSGHDAMAIGVEGFAAHAVLGLYRLLIQPLLKEPASLAARQRGSDVSRKVAGRS